ncbi:MAG: His/Gly/Thr/Pro-type tRNA ligase C-terminal domain-containing protein [Minisyncoccia bacterium]
MPKTNTYPKNVLTEFDRALVVAHYFGFVPTAAPKVTRRDLELATDCIEHPHYDAGEKLAVLRNYVETTARALNHPTAFIYEKQAARRKFGSHALHFVGSLSAIAEATLIRATLSILAEEGYKNLRVEINCIGDKESINNYERELLNHVKKSGINLDDELRRSIRKDVFSLFRLERAEIIPLVETAPSSITFLSAQSRAHFKEVLEYIEALGVEFRLTPRLVGEKNHSSHTIFAVKNTVEDKDNTLAVGYRYSRLGRFLGLRKEIPIAGVNVFSEGKDGEKRTYKKLPKPKFYLIQLGREAKTRVLPIIELLRSHRIPLYHLLGKDKLGVQLSHAESLKAPYLIIIGQKEALENTATVRNVATREQDTVSVTDLPRFLKSVAL